MTSDLRWNRHITHIKNKAIRSLGFLRRNFSQIPNKLKEQLYFTYVRSLLDYGCICWDPYTADLTEQLERVQNRAARFVLNDYSRKLSMTESKIKLSWQALKDR